MKILGNIFWLIFGGFATAMEYFTSGFILCLTIIGIPFGIQIFKLGILALWPFGSSVQEDKSSSGCLNVIMNIIWFFVGGLWIMLTHLVFGVLCCITIFLELVR